jgi:CheY-like chemotaxis protein
MGGDVPNGLNDIVVVDDNPVLLSVLSEILKEHCYTVRTASDGFAALAAIRCRVPDILLSDLNMPGMSGFELLSVVRRRFPAIAVIAMSGAYSDPTGSAGIAADGFYAKGSGSVFALLDILRAIDNVEVRQSRRAAAPIWIPGLPIQQGDRSTTAVACPECLRVFSHPLRKTTFLQQESCCPHCMYSLQFAVVRQSEEVDQTGIPLTIMESKINGSLYAR